MSYNGLPPKSYENRSPRLYSPPPPPIDPEAARTNAIFDLADAQREKRNNKSNGSGWFWGGLILGSLLGGSD